MEALRVQGNNLFSSHPDEAVTFYLKALDLYDEYSRAEPQQKSSLAAGADGPLVCTLEEYTKCAGNALTCLHKTGHIEECLALANRVLRVNPILAKASAFIGRCLLAHPELQQCARSSSASLPAGATPFLFLCRSVLQLPALGESVRPYLVAAVDQLRRQYATGREEQGVGREDSRDATQVVRLVDMGHGCGRGVVAGESILPFTLVSDTLDAFSAAPYEETGGKGCCLHCGQSVERPQEGSEGEAGFPMQANPVSAFCFCKGCQMAYYCCQKCADAHRECHEHWECDRLKKLKEASAKITAHQLDAPEEFYELAFHCITTIAAMKVRREGHNRVLQLESHAQEVSQALHPIVSLVHSLMPDEDATLVANVIGVLRCNSLEVVDPSGLGVGQVLHCANLISFFNHSCAPNCALDTRRPRPGIVTTRTIAKGEELTISYIPQLYWPGKLRQEALIGRYFFTCRCLRCLDGDTDPFERAICMELPAPRHSNPTEYFRGKVLATCTEMRGLSIGEITADHVSELLKLLCEVRKDLFAFHYLCHEIRNTLSFLYAVLNKPQECLNSCLEELLLWESLIPGALPIKQMKLQNALNCLMQLGNVKSGGHGGDATTPVLLDYIESLSLAYDVAELGE
ncbi:unnamed protein product [Phytomonas sp. EM1]|nr:unnamed protein product [Phytomonas sp. EM1]|eukprot:CCW63009.1 unnamed protein product [Phytomonas sp. isolate EM1]